MALFKSPLPTELQLRAIEQSRDIRYVATTRTDLQLIEHADQGLTFLGQVQKKNVHHLLTQWLIRQAKCQLSDWLNRLTQQHAFQVHGISIRQQRTLWGSCTAQKRINLNFKLLFLPKSLTEHVLLHELCHTEHFNHSRAFWQRLTQLDPLCSLHREALKNAHLFLPSWIPMG